MISRRWGGGCAPAAMAAVAMCSALLPGLAGCGSPGTQPAAATGEQAPRRAATRPALGTSENPIRASRGESELSRVVIRDKSEWDLAETAARSLGKIGAPAVPELTKDLASTDPEVRERAANVLARIGPAARQAVPDLVAALDDEDEAVRKAAALALGQIGPAAAEAVPALMRMMKEPVAEQPIESFPRR